MINRIAATAALLFLCTTAQADLILMLDDGLGNVITIGDGSASDAHPDAGVVMYSGTLGGFIVSVSTGLSYPTIGSELIPILHLNSVEVSSGAGGSLTVALTATGFLGPIGNGSSSFGIGGITDGTVEVNAYIDWGNVAFGTEVLIGTLSSTSGAFASSIVRPVTVGAQPFSLSLFSTITHSAGALVSSFDADVRVPEPGTLSIFGLGLLLLGIGRRRSRIYLNK